MASFEDRQMTFEQILKGLIELLPSSYNKEVSDTNYYKLLRALAFQLADAKIDIQEIGENRYLETAVNGEAIYNNFGYLVKLQKNPDWDDEKYRNLIKGVIQSLLKGPNKESLIEGFKLFSNFKVNIYELYKDSDKIDSAAYTGYNPKFTFALEIEKPVDEYVDQEILLRDANYIINIIKPAHTLSINIITIVGDENYRRYYRIDRKLAGIIEKCVNRKIQNKINEHLTHRFNNEAIDYAAINGITVDEAKEILRQISSGVSVAQYEQNIENKAIEKYNAYVSSLESYDVQIDTLDLFRIDSRTELKGTLELQWLQEEIDQVFKEETIDLTKEQINEMVEEIKNQIVLECENDELCNPSDTSEVEWYKRALQILKERYHRTNILNELGGEYLVRKKCKEYAETFRAALEKSYIENPPYIGMDKMGSEGAFGSTEGIFGWKHIGYDNQFITSTKNISKIGGSRLIGPRLILKDFSQIDAYQENVDVVTTPYTDWYGDIELDFELIYDKAFEDLFELEFSPFSEALNATTDFSDERHILLEETLEERVRFVYQHRDFKFEESTMPEEDYLIADRVEWLTDYAIGDLEEIFNDVIESECSGRMFRIVNNSEVDVELRVTI